MINHADGRKTVVGIAVASVAALCRILATFLLVIGTLICAPWFVARSLDAGSIHVNHFVTVAIALLASKRSSLI